MRSERVSNVSDVMWCQEHGLGKGFGLLEGKEDRVVCEGWILDNLRRWVLGRKGVGIDILRKSTGSNLCFMSVTLSI